MMPPCPCCSVVIRKADIQPDGTYELAGKFLVSFKCIPPCKTNRAIKFEHVPKEIREAAMLADLALRPDSPEMKG